MTMVSTDGSAGPDQQSGEGSDAAQAQSQHRNEQTPPFSLTTLVAVGGVALFAILVRTGWSNIVFVPLCSALLLLNPWIRTFLELSPISSYKDNHGEGNEDDDYERKVDDKTTGRESQQGGPRGRQYSAFDPARFVRHLTGQKSDKTVERQTDTSQQQQSTSAPPEPPQSLNRSEAYAALRRMPASLRAPLSDLEELVIRDCVCTWYDYHSFGDSSMPNEARFSIDHSIGSLFNAMEGVKSAEVTAELLLAAASVLLVTLRYRRLYPNRAPIFTNDQQRIQALREALDRVFTRHARQEDGQCDLLRTLLREIICKQLWNAICGVGEPDFINQQIVGWHERNQSKEVNQQRPTQPEHGYVARNGAFVASRGTASANSSSRPSPLPSHPSTPARQQSPVLYRQRDKASTTDGNRGSTIAADADHNSSHRVEPDLAGSSSPVAAMSRPPAPLSLANEPLTRQPKPMAMPSPLAKTGTPTVPPPSNNTKPNHISSMSEGTVPKLPPRPEDRSAKGTRSVDDAPSLMQHQQSLDTARAGSPAAGKSPTRTSQLLDVTDDILDAWDDGDSGSAAVLPMNVPPTAHQGMILPESLRKSMAANQRAGEAAHDGDPRTSLADKAAYAIPDEVAQGESAASDRNVIVPKDGGNRATSFDQDRPSALQSSPAVQSIATSQANASDTTRSPSLGFKPPARAPSASSNGIPPAPDLADVLSNKSADSASSSALRDAFESFLERGGVANRSLFFSPPSAATVMPGEGEALLKLHFGLATMARLVPDDTGEKGEVYREDAANIVYRSLQALEEVDDGVAGRPLREALATALRRLERPGDGQVREVLRPVESTLWNRLLGLYDHFWKETCTRPSGSSGGAGRALHSSSGPSTPSRTSFSSPEPREWKRSGELQRSGSSNGGSADLPYEPRKKNAVSMLPLSPLSATSALPPTENEERGTERSSARTEVGESSSTSAKFGNANPQSLSAVPTMESTAAMPPPPVPPRKEHFVQPSRQQSEVTARQPAPPAQDERGLEVTVTDVSVNAERPGVAVDPRTFEVMIAVEGLISDAGGFVLLRHWKDFQLLNEELTRSVSLPRLPVPLPDAKGKDSEALARQIKQFLEQLLTSPVHMTSDAVLYFVDKARAGEEANADRMGVLLDSLQLSKGLDFGRNLASGVVNTLQKSTRAAASMTGSGITGSITDSAFENSPVKRKMTTIPSLQSPAQRDAEARPSFASKPTSEAKLTSSTSPPPVERALNGAELAHLPIGIRKSQTDLHGHAGLGISHEDGRSVSAERAAPQPPPFGVSPAASHSKVNTAMANRHRRMQSTESAQPPKVDAPETPARMDTLPSITVPPSSAGAGSERHEHAIDSSPLRQSYTPTVPSPVPSPDPSAISAASPSSELSQADLDHLLSCLFAIADEAFNLSGGWTFRRGMLRVFEQIVRTQYWSSILGVFNNMVHSLNAEQLGHWCIDVKNKFWPDESPQGGAPSSVPPSKEKSSADVLGDAVAEAALEASQTASEPPVSEAKAAGEQKRTVGQRAATHAQAQSILLAHVPASTAYLLGPGGRQSCERAVICVHEEICQPSTSMDLVLTVVLKLCDIAAR